jgi:hypothetical protein
LGTPRRPSPKENYLPADAQEKVPTLPNLELGDSDSGLEDADKVDRRGLPEQQGPAVKTEPNILNLKALLAQGDRDLQQI